MQIGLNGSPGMHVKLSTSGVKDESHRRQKLDLESCGGVVLDPLDRVGF